MIIRWNELMYDIKLNELKNSSKNFAKTFSIDLFGDQNVRSDGPTNRARSCLEEMHLKVKSHVFVIPRSLFKRNRWAMATDRKSTSRFQFLRNFEFFLLLAREPEVLIPFSLEKNEISIGLLQNICTWPSPNVF